jgi:nitrous oxidase accessory protein NosD
MKRLLNQRTIIVPGLALIAVLLLLIAVATGKTKPSSEDIDMAVSDQQTWIVCPQGLPVCRFTQIQAAIDAAPEGAVITIKTGTYEENLIVRKSLTLQAAEGEQVIIKSPLERFPTLLLVSGWYTIHVEIRGITFQPARPQQGNGIEIMGMVAARLEHNTIQDYQWGILVLGKAEGISNLPVIIHENMIHSSIRILQSTRVTVSKNAIQGNAAPEPIGIAIDYSGDIVVSENLIEGGSGVWILLSGLIDMTRNIIRKNFAGVTIEGSKVSVSDNQIEQNGWGVAVISRFQQGALGSLVWLTGNRITQQELFGLGVERLEYIATCEGNHIRDNKEGDYRVQSPLISLKPERDPAAEEKLRQQCEGG